MSETVLAEITLRHKVEKKNLQASIQALKKSATKGDKKKKKEVQDEINLLEKRLEERHLEEIKELGEAVENRQVSDENHKPAETHAILQEEPSDAISPESEADGLHKTTKAQRRRDKKAQHGKQREIEISEQEKANKDGKRQQESLAIAKELLTRGLRIQEISSDGNCMYMAINHQLQQDGQSSLGNSELRRMTATYMRAHRDDFLPFLTSSKGDEVMSEEDFESYCQKMELTSAWGGQLELRALSHVLKRPIEIIQGDAPSLTIGEEYKDGKSILLTYHRHIYGLGAHYNSVAEFSKSKEGLEETVE